MKKKNKWQYGLPLVCLLVTAVLAITACPPPIEVVEDILDEEPDVPQGPVLGVGFTKAPELTFTGNWDGSGINDRGYIQYSFTPVDPDTGDITYTVYIAEDICNKSADVIQRGDPYDQNPGTQKKVRLSNNAGVWFSAVVVAEKADGNSQAISAVVQSAVNSGYAEIEKAAGDTLFSRGKATAPGAKTYYIDYENGKDTNDGTSAITAWKTFVNVNKAGRVFKPGDHILLNADCIWNGITVDEKNCKELSIARGNGGMLWLSGNNGKTNNGTAERPIVIDLYRHENYDQNTMKVIYSAKQRPIINGNGTPSTDPDNPYGGTGAIHSSDGLSYWEIRNIEATNSFENFADPAIRAKHWYTRPGKYGGQGAYKALYGIYWRSDYAGLPLKGLLIENCYLHDIQSFHSNNQDDSTDWTTNTYFGFAAGKPGKAGGGIGVAFSESTIKGNIIRRTGYMGLRTYTSSDYMSKKNNFIGNYIDTVYGDGLVISSTRGSPTEWSVIENNIFKNICAAPNHGSGNFAACWAMNSRYTLFQYNEAYGTLYGSNDGEAWDIDIDSNNTIYQYNYSHHNAGGSLLIMGTANGVYRYNVSANDGLSSRGLYNILKDGKSPADGPQISTSASSYTSWQNGQCIFHYTYNGTTANNNVPLIYNNTFYIGPNVPSVGVVGHNTGQVNKYVRFYNNIILKAGQGTVHLSYGQQNSGNTTGYIYNPSTGFKNNLLWAYRDLNNPDAGDYTGIQNGTDQNATPIQTLTSSYGNKWANPRLKIQEAGMTDVLRDQLNTVFAETEANNNDPANLEKFVSTGRIRARASLFMPVDQAAADALKIGMVMPGSANSSIDNAWNDGFVTMDNSGSVMLDFFGDPITNPPAVGASNGVFNSAKYNPAQ